MDKLISFKPYMDKDSDRTIVHGELYSEFNRLKSHMNYNMYYNDLCKFVVDNISNLLTSAVARNPDALYIITDTDFLAALSKALAYFLNSVIAADLSLLSIDLITFFF